VAREAPPQADTDAPTAEDKLEATRITVALERLLKKCTGEAHSNAFIDNCMMCAPRWGKLVNRNKVMPGLQVDEVAVLVNLEDAWPFARVLLNDNERRAARALRRFGFAEMVGAYDAQAKITPDGADYLIRTGKTQNKKAVQP
jgi:hypothetical protein